MTTKLIWLTNVHRDEINSFVAECSKTVEIHDPKSTDKCSLWDLCQMQMVGVYERVEDK